jgi:hypothetical protein
MSRPLTRALCLILALFAVACSAGNEAPAQPQPSGDGEEVTPIAEGQQTQSPVDSTATVGAEAPANDAGSSAAAAAGKPKFIEFYAEW